MAISNEANIACDRIHNLIQKSGLHFIINQTPWSSYITIRRKFVTPGMALHASENEVHEEQLKLYEKKTPRGEPENLTNKTRKC